MATLPANFKPTLNGISGNRNVRKRKVQFGEGYIQQSVDSTNPVLFSGNLQFFIWGDDELNQLIDFFDDLGAGFLQYTLPNETTAANYTVGAIAISYVDAMQRNVTVPIERVY